MTDRRPTADRIAECIADYRALMTAHASHMAAGRYHAARTAARDALEALVDLPLTDDTRAMLRRGIASMKAATAAASAARAARAATASGAAS
jgi:hypothetical protein